MTKTQTVKLSGIWEFYSEVSSKCPAIYVLTSYEEMRRAYGSNGTWKERVTALYYSAEKRSMENCEISNSQYQDYTEDCQFSNEAEIDAIANELASVLGHTNF